MQKPDTQPDNGPAEDCQKEEIPQGPDDEGPVAERPLLRRLQETREEFIRSLPNADRTPETLR